MFHDPKAEVWTFNSFAWDGQPVLRLGINLGAPGDRLSDAGTLWLDYPPGKSPSPNVPLKIEADRLQYFRYHGSRVEAEEDNGELGWVAASGVRGIRALTLTLANADAEARKYTVRLHFAEVDNLEAGQRIFSFAVPGQRRKDFDIAREAGGPNRAVVHVFEDVEVADKLTVSFSPAGNGGSPPPILCGIEVVAER